MTLIEILIIIYVVIAVIRLIAQVKYYNFTFLKWSRLFKILMTSILWLPFLLIYLMNLQSVWIKFSRIVHIKINFRESIRRSKLLIGSQNWSDYEFKSDLTPINNSLGDLINGKIKTNYDIASIKLFYPAIDKETGDSKGISYFPGESKHYFAVSDKSENYNRKVRWFFAMTDEFIKSISKIDRKLQGRILEALEIICKNPIELKGDTIKPLIGDLAGLWRYRIGDFRLIYQPDQKNKQIILHAFSSRGGVYE